MAWIIMGSLFALALVVAIVFVVRSKRRNRRGLCAHCGGSLDTSRSFTLGTDVICRSCAEDCEDHYRLLALLHGIIGVPVVLIASVFLASLLLDREAAGWVKIVAATFWVAGILNLAIEALRASLRPSRLSMSCATVWLLALIMLTVLALKGGESSKALRPLCMIGAGFPMGVQAIVFRKRALWLSKELEAPQGFLS